MFPGLKSSSYLLYSWKYKSFNANGKAVEGYIEVKIRNVVIVY
jgi:hypothetical protein